MQIVIALVFGAAVGGVLHFLQGGRDFRGAALSPILGTIAGGATWLVLTWLGLTIADPLLWLIALAAPLVVVPLTLAALTRRRAAADVARRAALGIG